MDLIFNLSLPVIEPAERESRRAPTRESCTPKGLSDSLGHFFHILAHFEPFSPIPFGSLLRLWMGSRGLCFGPFWIPLASLEGSPGFRFGPFWLRLASLEGSWGSVLVNFGYFLESLEVSWRTPGRGLRNVHEILPFWFIRPPPGLHFGFIFHKKPLSKIIDFSDTFFH